MTKRWRYFDLFGGVWFRNLLLREWIAQRSCVWSCGLADSEICRKTYMMRYTFMSWARAVRHAARSHSHHMNACVGYAVTTTIRFNIDIFRAYCGARRRSYTLDSSHMKNATFAVIFAGARTFFIRTISILDISIRLLTKTAGCCWLAIEFPLIHMPQRTMCCRSRGQNDRIANFSVWASLTRTYK